jgi:hypothetical protein
VKATIEVSSEIARSARVMQVEGLFDVPPAERAELRWDVELPIEDRPWHVGLIVGPSGCGKSTVARRFFSEPMARSFDWPSDKSLLDAFPKAMGAKEIVELLSSVGFSSPPSWVRPFHVLSNGEQFRVTLARLLAELPELAVVDEFTSVVDRTVAQIGSAALAKTVRRRGQKFVAVTCHEDVLEWLQPDWVYRPAEQTFGWRSLQRRPPIELEIRRVHHSAWRLFGRHHYLSADISHAAVCFCAFWKGVPVAFDAWLPFVGRLKDTRKGQARPPHRVLARLPGRRHRQCALQLLRLALEGARLPRVQLHGPPGGDALALPLAALAHDPAAVPRRERLAQQQRRDRVPNARHARLQSRYGQLRVRRPRDGREAGQKHPRPLSLGGLVTLTLEQASRLYHVPVTDYRTRDDDGGARGNGLLVSSGAGMMMAAMDCCPSLRWCVDVDDLRGRPTARVTDFLLCAERVASPLAICGWFSISNPDEIVAAVRAMNVAASRRHRAIVYLGNLRLGLPGEVQSFQAFIANIKAAA